MWERSPKWRNLPERSPKSICSHNGALFLHFMRNKNIHEKSGSVCITEGMVQLGELLVKNQALHVTNYEMED